MKRAKHCGVCGRTDGVRGIGTYEEHLCTSCAFAYRASRERLRTRLDVARWAGRRARSLAAARNANAGEDKA